MNHVLNYKRALPLGIVFSLASIAAIVTFLYYSADWAEHEKDGLSWDELEQYNRMVRAQYSYYAGVIALLVLIVFFNGYHLTRA